MQHLEKTQEQRDETIRELTARIVAGSELAFNELYEVIFASLYRQVLVQTAGNEELCKEVVQATLVRLVKYMRAFDNERAFWGWLRQVARSCHIDLLRKAGREPLQLSIDAVNLSTAETVSEDGELLSALDRSLTELAPAERELVQLAYFEGVAHRDIALKLATSPKAVESKLARTREKLRGLLLAALKQYVLL